MSDLFPEITEQAEIKKLADQNPQQAVIARALLNVSLALVNTRSAISSTGSWVKDAISKLEDTIKKANDSSDKLARTITVATWAGVIVAILTLGWDIFKTFYFTK